MIIGVSHSCRCGVTAQRFVAIAAQSARVGGSYTFPEIDSHKRGAIWRLVFRSLNIGRMVQVVAGILAVHLPMVDEALRR